MTWILVGAAINLALVLLFFISLSRIETNTRKTAEQMEILVSELQALNFKALEVKRDGLPVQQPIAREHNHG